MEVIKKTAEYTIYQKRSKKYAIKDASRRWISGDEKVKILVSEKLLDIPMPKEKSEEAPEEQATEASSEEAAPAEDSAEEAEKAE